MGLEHRNTLTHTHARVSCACVNIHIPRCSRDYNILPRKCSRGCHLFFTENQWLKRFYARMCPPQVQGVPLGSLRERRRLDILAVSLNRAHTTRPSSNTYTTTLFVSFLSLFCYIIPCPLNKVAQERILNHVHSPHGFHTTGKKQNYPRPLDNFSFRPLGQTVILTVSNKIGVMTL